MITQKLMMSGGLMGGVCIDYSTYFRATCITGKFSIGEYSWDNSGTLVASSEYFSYYQTISNFSSLQSFSNIVEKVQIKGEDGAIVAQIKSPCFVFPVLDYNTSPTATFSIYNDFNALINNYRSGFSVSLADACYFYLYEGLCISSTRASVFRFYNVK